MQAELFFDFRTRLELAVSDAREALEAHLCDNHAELPDNLRAATASDIIEGAILWYPKWSDFEDFDDFDDDGNEIPVGCWKEIYEVEHPNDAFKAYTADDGCRYGLDGAFVQQESK